MLVVCDFINVHGEVDETKISCHLFYFYTTAEMTIVQYSLLFDCAHGCLSCILISLIFTVLHIMHKCLCAAIVAAWLNSM